VRFLILAHPGDATATLVAARLRQRHPPEETRLVSLDEIIFAPHWVHTLNGARPRTVLTLHDGAAIQTDQIGIVFNRLRYVDMPHFGTSAKIDREYAVMEMFALLLSWLKALACPIISPISPQSLAGPSHSSLAWQHLAGKAGLPTARMRITSSLRRYSVPDLMACPASAAAIGNVPAWLIEPLGNQLTQALVVGDRVLGNIPDHLIPGCLKLASLSGLELLLIHFASDLRKESLKFNGVDPFPSVAGDAAIEAIVEVLEARS
jgi:hypothetical protein